MEAFMEESYRIKEA
jgi:hypothetical protein